MSEWIEHDGKGMPVHGEQRVDVKYLGECERSGVPAKWLHAGGNALSDWLWTIPGDEFNIVAYRLSEPQGSTPPSSP